MCLCKADGLAVDEQFSRGMKYGYYIMYMDGVVWTPACTPHCAPNRALLTLHRKGYAVAYGGIYCDLYFIASVRLGRLPGNSARRRACFVSLAAERPTGVCVRRCLCTCTCGVPCRGAELSVWAFYPYGTHCAKSTTQGVRSTYSILVPRGRLVSYHMCAHPMPGGINERGAPGRANP